MPVGCAATCRKVLLIDALQRAVVLIYFNLLCALLRGCAKIATFARRCGASHALRFVLWIVLHLFAVCMAGMRLVVNQHSFCMNWILDGICVSLLSIVLTGIIIPQILLIAFRKKLFDVPDQRKIHKAAVPRLGGLAFMPAIIFSLCFVVCVEFLMEPSKAVGYVNSFASDDCVMVLCAGLCSLMMMYLVGIADDLIGVKYRAKFVCQILAASMLAVSGIRLVSLHGMLGFDVINPVASYALTILLIVYIINAFNLIDGIDGLASGLGAIAMAFYAVVFYSLDLPQIGMLALAGFGTLVPFFYYNVFGNPLKQKKIFMGDTGALTIGLLLSFLSMAMTRVDVDSICSANIMVVAFSPIAIPCLDVLRVFVHRIIRGQSPFLPDCVHIHHKILALGVSQRVVMVSILVMAALFMVLNMILSRFIGVFMVLVCDLVIWITYNWALTRAIRKRKARLGITGGYC